MFDVAEIDTREPASCISGQILRGIKKPHDCPAFGTRARRSIRSARRWSRPKARAPPTTRTAAT